VQIDAVRRPLTADLTHQPADGIGVGPAHGVGQLDQIDGQLMLVCEIHQAIDQTHDVGGLDITLVIAAECRHHTNLGDRHLPLAGGLDALDRLRERFIDAAVGVLAREGFAGGDAQFSEHRELARLQRPHHPLTIQVDARVDRTGPGLYARHDLLSVGHLRDPLGADEGRHLNLRESALRQAIDQTNLVRRRNRILLDLHSLTGPDLMDVDALGQAHCNVPVSRFIICTANNLLAVVQYSIGFLLGLAQRFFVKGYR
jgi:hypothetical protein